MLKRNLKTPPHRCHITEFSSTAWFMRGESPQAAHTSREAVPIPRCWDEICISGLKRFTYLRKRENRSTSQHRSRRSLSQTWMDSRHTCLPITFCGFWSGPWLDIRFLANFTGFAAAPTKFSGDDVTGTGATRIPKEEPWQPRSEAQDLTVIHRGHCRRCRNPWISLSRSCWYSGVTNPTLNSRGSQLQDGRTAKKTGTTQAQAISVVGGTDQESISDWWI